MEEDTQPKLSKKLQVVTLCPLLSGILICTIIILAILFSNYLSWIDTTTSYIESKELESLGRLATAASNVYKSKIEQLAFELSTIRNLYASSDIYLEKDPISYINTKFAYDELSQKTSDPLYSEWFTSNKASSSFSSYSGIYSNIAISDVFMRIFMELDRNYSQIGFILDGNNGMDYRYPLNDMSFLDGTFTYNSTSPCNKENTNYDSRCSEAYTLLKSGHEVIIFNEDSKTKVLLDGPQGAFVYYLPTDFFNEVFSLLTDYSFFLTDFTGNRVIKINQDSDISGTIWEALFANDAKLIESGKSNMGVSYTNLSESGGNTTSFAVTGYNSEYLGALQQLDISVDSQVNDGVHEIASMAVGITVDKGLVLSNWNDVLDGVINTIIIQMVIFLILLCITIAVVWFLGLSITNRITYPIYLFEEYLRGNIDLQAMSKNYNKEVNQILTYLRMLETLEKMINPNFLKNPKIPIRENNLKEALKLFEDIKNRRGKSIIMNLLGNIRYQDNDYQKAVSYYRNALNEIEELTKEVLQQEEDERGLSDAEKLALTRKAGKESLSWEAEKNFLDETLIERKQQLCMGLQAELKESVVELSEVRTKLKEINNYQYEILQHYALTRTHFLRLLKVMIDIAAVFQELKYYHSGIELLDIVHDELKKLEAEVGPEVDIDITRLGRIGVNIKVDDEHNKRLHFVLKNITFEKDVLAQAMYYRRGLLLLENDKHYEAGIAFTLAIEKGQFYDPHIRELSVKALHNLMEKFGLLKDATDLKDMYKNINSAEYSLMLILSYDLYMYTKISDSLVEFIEKRIRSKWKLGARSLNPDSTLKMEMINRDLPGRDLENLILSSKGDTLKDSVYDVSINSLKGFSEDYTQKIMLIIIGENPVEGSSSLKDMHLITDQGIKLFVIAREGVLSDEFEKFMENTMCTLIEFGESQSFAKALQYFYGKV